MSFCGLLKLLPVAGGGFLKNEGIIAENLYQVILELGFQPYEPAGTTNEAIERINNTAPDLAIVDIHTGNNFSGFKVAEVLNNKNIPFILLSINTINKPYLWHSN
jgi:ActR/RegA family two-component response regulator